MSAGTIILLILAVLCVFVIAPGITAYLITFCHKKPTAPLPGDPEKRYYTGHEEEYREFHNKVASLPYERLRLESEDGVELYGDYCDNKSGRLAILVHGFRAEPNVNFAALGAFLWSQGYSLFFPYSRGHAPSTGSVTLGMLEQEDLLKWLGFLRENYAPTEVIVGGISMGATTVAYASDRMAGVSAMILDCGFLSPYSQMSQECRRRHVWPVLVMPVVWLCAKIDMKKDIRRPVTETLREIDIPAFFIHGEKDRTVPVEEGAAIYEACGSKKYFLRVPGAPHTAGFIFGGEKARNALTEFLKECNKL